MDGLSSIFFGQKNLTLFMVAPDFSFGFGGIIAAGYMYMEAKDVPQVELRGLWDGLKCAITKYGIRKLWIEGDSSTIIGALTSDVDDGGCPIFSDYRQMIHSLLEVMISHIFREGNQGADWLANTDRTSKSYRFFWDHFPVQLVRIVENDLSTSYPRL